MDLREKIEEEIKRLETELKYNTIYTELQKRIYEAECLKQDLENNPTYQTLQTLKTLLTETIEPDYKILEHTHVGVRGKRSKQENRLPNTSHYTEMLDFLEVHLEIDPAPIDITRLYNIAVEAGYEIGGKRPPNTLSSYLSRDPRFTPTNKGWILTKHVQSDNS